MNKLTDEQIIEIVNEYGSSKEIIERVEEILSVIDFSNEDYLNIIIQIASEYETNELKKEYNSRKTYNSLNEIIKHVLVFKLKDLDEHKKVYKLLNNAIDEVQIRKDI